MIFDNLLNTGIHVCSDYHFAVKVKYFHRNFHKKITNYEEPLIYLYFADKTAVLIHYEKLKSLSKIVILGARNFHYSEIKISGELKTEWESEHTY